MLCYLDGSRCRQLLVVFVSVVNVADLGGREAGQGEENLAHCLRTNLKLVRSWLVVNVDV